MSILFRDDNVQPEKIRLSYKRCCEIATNAPADPISAGHLADIVRETGYVVDIRTTVAGKRRIYTWYASDTTRKFVSHMYSFDSSDLHSGSKVFQYISTTLQLIQFENSGPPTPGGATYLPLSNYGALTYEEEEQFLRTRLAAISIARQ